MVNLNTKYTLLHRVSSSDEIAIETETIDASALEDKIERTIAGRGSTGGTFGVRRLMERSQIKLDHMIKTEKI